tara:strand:+ start:1286 stop:1435 length:150 start_codon:yes stop_codon:yes gene_type:complete
MAVKAKGGINKSGWMPGSPKKTRQGHSPNSKLSASSRNGKKKAYRGQGR